MEAYESNLEKKKEAARKAYNANSKYKVVHTFHMQVSLSSNGHEKTKEMSNNFKKVNRDPEKNYLNKMKIEFEILLYLRSLF